MESTTLIIILVAIVALVAIMAYNNLVRLRNNRENAFADIDVQLKHRYDLIPQLVDVVKGYAKHEKETLTQVIALRNEALAAQTTNEKVAIENRISGIMPRFRLMSEAYPDLKANTNFMHLQEEMADVENKLAAVRRYFNSATREFNNAVQVFPNNLFAGIFGFQKAEMFDLGSERTSHEQRPTVNF